jgi:uroporphyrinogen-III decarboxylase
MANKENLFQERLNRYKIAMDCGKPDKVPVVMPLSEWVVKYTNHTIQEAYYDFNIETEIIENTVKDLDFDILGGFLILWWPPLYDAVRSKYYKFPGLSLEENVAYQYFEQEYMKAEDYDDFIANPTEWLVRNFMPRINEELSDPGSYRAAVALMKGAAAFDIVNTNAGKRTEKMAREHGLVMYTSGMTKAPFDTLGDALRGMKGILTDLRRRPEKVEQACEMLVAHNIAFGMITAAGEFNLPAFAPLHRGSYPFLSMEQWERFYWPTWKKVIEGLWAQGKRTLFYAEGDWTPYLEKIAELPEKSIVFAIDNTDPKKAKEILGGKFCLWGGIHPTLLTYGTPQEVKDQVKRSIDELAGDGGFVLAPGGVVLSDAKRENVIAMIEAAREYGAY